MFWRESLKIGVEEIDTQHEELFSRVNSFLEVVRGDYEQKEKAKKIAETLDFMGEYVVTHFDAEEKLQREKGYPNFGQHHKIHENFKKSVVDFKTKFENEGYDEDLVQSFSGRITTWLVNHVAQEDQKISDYIGNVEKESEKSNEQEYMEIILNSTKNVFESMLQLSLEEIKSREESTDDKVSVMIEIIGDLKGKIVYTFPKGTALSMVEKMAGMEMEELDSFVGSAVGELTNIISGNTLNSFDEKGHVCDITTPAIFLGDDKAKLMADDVYETINITTDIGEFEFSATIN